VRLSPAELALFEARGIEVHLDGRRVRHPETGAWTNPAPLLVRIREGRA
jgi:hypothetical protein